MVHNSRIFYVAAVRSPKDLVGKLFNTKTPLCSGFYHEGFLYLNDSLSEESERKFAILKMTGFPHSGRWELDQVKTLGLSGSTHHDVLAVVENLHNAEPSSRVVVQLDGPGHRCPLCA